MHLASPGSVLSVKMHSTQTKATLEADMVLVASVEPIHIGQHGILKFLYMRLVRKFKTSKKFK